MRLPKITQLTQAQKDVYLYAPTDRHILVHGPPGTGKTLIACLRAMEIAKRGSPVVLGMFNAVLSRYSSNAGDGAVLPSQTVHRWFCTWWLTSGLPPHDGPEAKIIIHVPFEQKDEVKALGARWDKSVWRANARKPGAWVMSPEQYQEKRELFRAGWQALSDPPRKEGTPWIDWPAVEAHVSQSGESIIDAALSLGSVLIDEGQDFPPSFYRTLRWLAAYGQSRKGRVEHPLRCCILADENQQITEENSTLDQITSELKIATEHRYKLLDNFRNSREIAQCAAAFFNDVGFLPNLPKRSGEKPVFVTAPNHAHVAQRIKTWIVNNPGKEAGVLTFSEGTRDAICQMLEPALNAIRGREIVLQTYSSKTWQENRSRDLVFDTGDIVTVLNLQSCKGLEFDAVFLIDPHQAKASQQAADRFRMQMFVAVSRARECVTLMDTGPQAGTGDYVKFLPGEDLLEREVISGDATPVDRTAAGAKTIPAAEKGSPKPWKRGDVGGDWEKQLNAVVKSHGLKMDDRRKSGGALWVTAGPELEPILKPLGLQFTAKKAAWWRK
jgi:DNA helicase II / ATP-dependent DNA helicase PcrA